MLDPNKAPGKNFDLSHWKLTRPDGKEISPQMLSDGYVSAGVFYTDPRNGGCVLACPNIGGTSTPNSKYLRCELREMRYPTAPTSANNWTPEQGGTMKAKLSVDRVGGQDNQLKVVIGQIHGPESEVVRLYYHALAGNLKGSIYCGMDTVDNENTFHPEIASVPLGQPFRYTINLFGRRLAVYIRTKDGVTRKMIKTIDPRYKGLGQYFKVGAYNQQTGGDPGDGVKVTVYALSVTHP